MATQAVKTFLVTGAGRRVGACIARTLHAAGSNIVLHYRYSQAEAEKLATQFNAIRLGSAVALQANLLDLENITSLLETLIGRFGRLDGVVNNASSFYPTPIGEIQEYQWDDLVGTNLKAPLFLAQAAAPHLKTQEGSIVNIIDIHAERPLASYPVYSAAKAGLAGLTRALALELAPYVRVNGIAPGAIEWPEDGQIANHERASIIEHSLLKRMGSPQDVASAVRFLMLEAPYITGQILAVDGGRSIHL